MVDKQNSQNNNVSRETNENQPHLIISVYVVMTTIVGCILLYILFDSTSDQIQESQNIKHIFLRAAGMMICSGILGGCLYDIRGLIKHSIKNNFNKQYNLSYILRPFAGALSGLIIFLLLLGGVMSFDMGGSEGSNFGKMGWTTFKGRMPYVTFALLAGYASHSFMLKLKDISDSVFATKEYQIKESLRTQLEEKTKEEQKKITRGV